MAEIDGQVAVEQQQQQGKICYGDCFSCGYQQAWLCTAMNSLRTMRMAESLAVELQALKAQVAELQEKFGSEPEPPVQEAAAEPQPTEKKKK